jgi:hypothetical protein
MQMLGSKPVGEGLLFGDLLLQSALPGAVQALSLLTPDAFKAQVLRATDGLQPGRVLTVLKRELFGFRGLSLPEAVDLLLVTAAQTLHLTLPGLFGASMLVYRGIGLGGRPRQCVGAERAARHRADGGHRDQQGGRKGTGSRQDSRSPARRWCPFDVGIGAYPDSHM